MNLRQRLQSSNPHVRYDAVSELSIVDGSKAEDLLIVALNDDNRTVRLTAAQVLGQRKDKRAVVPLIEMLKDNDIGMRAEAAGALGTIGSKKATKPLIDLLEGSLARKPNGDYTTLDWGKDTDAAVSALMKITGQDFGFDIAKWRAWATEEKAVEVKLICFRYAGDVSDKPFFPLIFTQEGMPKHEAAQMAGLQNDLLPPMYFYLSATNLADTAAAIKPVVVDCDEATNAEYGDFSVIILESDARFIKTIGRKDMCRLLQRIPPRILENNKNLDEEITELKERLSI